MQLSYQLLFDTLLCVLVVILFVGCGVMKNDLQAVKDKLNQLCRDQNVAPLEE